MKAETLVEALSNTLTKDISDNCGHTNLCKAQGTGEKKKGDTLAGLKAYTVVHTLIKVLYTKAHVFAQVKAKSVTDTLKCY